MDEYCKKCNQCENHLSKYDIYNNVKNAAYEIIKRKGATYYGVALAVRRIVECIERDENSILTVSSLLDGQYGLYDLCLSLPTVVNRNGIGRVLDVPLSGHEEELLMESGNALNNVIKDLKL